MLDTFTRTNAVLINNIILSTIESTYIATIRYNTLQSLYFITLHRLLRMREISI